MKSVKKIIWIIWDFWFFETNKKSFEDLNLLVLQIKNEDDLKKCDWIFFWTSSFFQIKNYFEWDLNNIFFDKILEKIENNFPIFCSWQSVDLFLEKIWWEEKILEKKWKIFDLESKIFLNFLDSKENNVKVYKNFSYEEKEIFWIKKYLSKIKKNKFEIQKFWEKSSWKDLVYIYKKTLFVIFSPEFYWDKRIYEYFVNNFF